jgi:ABC-2 type transport system ATP-binding protein
MSDPRRLVYDHPSALARTLLDAARDEAPVSSLLESTLELTAGTTSLAAGTAAARSTAAGTAAARSTAAGTAAARSTASSAPIAVAKSATVLATTVKWLGIAGVGLLAVSGVRAVTSNGAAPVTPARTVMPLSHHQIPGPQERSVEARRADEAQSPRPRVEAQRTDETQRALPLDEPARSRARHTPLNVSPSERSTSLGSTKPSALGRALAEEAQLLDRARAAVSQGNASKALELLDEHRSRFPGGTLRPESLYLRMQALRLRGNTKEASRIAEALLDAYPNGPQSAAARALLNAE